MATLEPLLCVLMFRGAVVAVLYRIVLDPGTVGKEGTNTIRGNWLAVLRERVVLAQRRQASRLSLTRARPHRAAFRSL